MTTGPVGAAPPFRRPVLVGLLLFALTLRGPFVVISTVTGELNSELGMSVTAIGVLTSLPVLCFGLAAPGASALIARLGVERSVLLSLVGTMVGVLIRSTGGIPGALFGTLVMGLAITVGNVVSPVLIGRDFRGRAATVTGGYTAALNVGSMITLTATGPLVIRRPTTQVAQGSGQAAPPAKDLPVSSANTATGTVPAAGAVPGQVDTAPKATITIRTDLYTADVNTVGGVISLVALNQHRDGHDDAKPYLALQRNAERTYVAQAGLLGEGLPNHRTVYEVLPGPRELAPGADRVELKLAATTASGDKVVQVLTFHRGSYVIDAAFDLTNSGAAPIVALRLLPAHPRHEAAGRAQLGRAVGVHENRGVHRKGQVSENRIRRN